MPLRRFLRGSFRGAPFHIQEHDSLQGGRRLQVHEYPGRNQAYPEDLGKITPLGDIECYVIGKNYHLGRDLLVAACNREGPGILVHPYLGIHRVSCSECRVSERSSEGNMARFTLRFVSAGANIQPASAIDTIVLLATATGSMKAAAAAQFVSRFTP